MASTAERWTMCNGRAGAKALRETTSDIAYVSNDGGRDDKKVSYDVRGPEGASGGREVCTTSPTESVIGGIISAWNINVVGSSANAAMALAMSDDDTAGNSATYKHSQH